MFRNSTTYIKKLDQKTNNAAEVELLATLRHALTVHGASPFSAPWHTCRTKASTCHHRERARHWGVGIKGSLGCDSERKTSVSCTEE